MFQLQRGGLQKIVPKMLPSCHHLRRIKEERNLKSIKILYLELFYLTLEISAHFYRRLPIFSPHSRYLPKSNAISKLNFRQENLQHKLGQRMARYWNFAVHKKAIMKTKFCPCCQDLILKILLLFDIRTSASPSSVFVQYKRAAVVTSNVSSKQ